MGIICFAIGLTDIGRVREENQDAFLIDNTRGLFVVVDGMGGLQEGSAAAQFVVQGLPMLLQQKLSSQETKKSDMNIEGILSETISELSSILGNKKGKGTGATVVLCLKKGKKVYIAHLGDSRAYYYRSGTLKKLTKDHNIAALLAETGKITENEVRTHPMRNRLTAYVGMEGKAIPEIKQAILKSGDQILLCSDGLSAMLPDTEIAQILKEESNAKTAVKKLINKANEAGGKDNITAILISCEQETPKLTKLKEEKT